jgi:hypothetical protein
MMIRPFPCTSTHFALVLLLSVLAGTSHAAPLETHTRARKRFDEGLTLVDKGDLAAALLAFKEAYALEPNPVVLYNVGQAYRALDRPQEAMDALERYRAESGAQLDPADRQAIDQQIRALKERLATRPAQAPQSIQAAPDLATGSLELRCLGAGTRVFADGRWMGEGPFQGRLTMAEGLHEVRFENKDGPVDVRSVRIQRNQQISQTCTLPIPTTSLPIATAVATPARRPPSRGPILTLASGGALLGGALGVHLWNHGRYLDWKRDMAAPAATDVMELDRVNSLNQRIDDVHKIDKVTLGLTAVGGLLVSLAVAWWWTRSHPSE